MIKWFRKEFHNWTTFLWFIIGNFIQLFIIIVFIDFLWRNFNEWLVDFYVMTNCNYSSFYEMFEILFGGIIVILALALGRFIWFKIRYLKRISKKDVIHETKD